MGGDPLGRQERYVREMEDYRCIYLTQDVVTSPSERVQYQEVGAKEAALALEPTGTDRSKRETPQTT